MFKSLPAAFALLLASASASSQDIVVNEFYRGGNLSSTDEWIEVVLLADLSAAEVQGYLVGDSQSATTSKLSAYRFANMAAIASDFPAGTIIVLSGDTGPAVDGSYDPAGGDWNLTLRTSGSNITTVTGGGDLAGTDVVWVDTVASGSTIAPDGFCVNYDSTPGTFGAVCQVTITAPSNNTGSVLAGDVTLAASAAGWTSSVALAAMSPGLPNGLDNTTSIDNLRSALGGVPVLSLDSPSVLEGDSGDMPLLTFTATLDAPANGDCVFSADTFDAGGPNEATPNVDYVVSSFPGLTIADGTTSVQFSVPVIGDDLIEGDEIVTIDIFGEPADCDIFSASNFGTIIDDDVAEPELSIDDVAIVEGTGAGTTEAVFTVTLQNPMTPPAFEGGTITVDYASMDGSALAGIDYTAVSGTLTFTGMPGETRTISVPITREDIFEADESFSVMLSFPFGATIADDSGAGTILNDDGFPVPSVADIALLEGSGGGFTAFNFTVTLSNPSSTPATFLYTTVNGTAVSPGDYIGTGTLVPISFNPLQTQQTVSINVVADSDPEADEQFVLELYGFDGAIEGKPSFIDDATATIIDDDFSLSIDDATVTEGTGAGTTTAGFTVSISAQPPPGLTVTVDYATLAGSATEVDDFLATSGTLTFGIGLPLSQPIAVDIVRDNLDEFDEQFSVMLSNAVNVAIADGSGDGTIVDDDTAEVDIADLSQAEGSGGGNTAFVFQLSLSNPADRVLNFSVFTNDISAVAPGDYSALSGQPISFPAGSQSASVTVQVVADDLPEPDEQFTVQVNPGDGPGAGEGSLASAIGTIVNDDSFMLSVADASVTEGTGPGTTTLDFVVTLSSAPLPQSTVTVDYATVAGSALSPDDFAATSGTLSFTATGPLSQTISVPVVRDAIDEHNEGLSLELSNAVGATIVDGGAAGTIIDDDEPPLPQVGDQSLIEGDSGSQAMVFTINLPNPSSFELNFAVWTVDGTATSPADYSGIPATDPQIITFAPGQISQTVSIDVLGDVLVEGNEAFSLFVDFAGDDAPSGNGGPLASASGAITDDDIAVLSINDVTALEGNGGGLTPFVFTVSTAKPFAVATAIPIQTFPGSAVEPDDFLGQMGTVTLPAMALSAPLTIQVVADDRFEPTETFTVELAAVPLSTIGDGEGLGTILDDEVAIPVPLLGPGGLLLMLLTLPWLARGRLRRLRAGP